MKMTQVKERFEAWKIEYKWEYASNYSGPDYSDYIVIYGRCRDSDILTNSNWDTLIDDLQAEIDSEVVEVSGASHWAVGWVETLLIRADAPLVTLFKAFEYREALNDYPVLDDCAYSNAEYEYAYEYAEQAADSVAAVLGLLFGLPDEITKSKDFLGLCISLNVEHQIANGVGESALYDNQYHIDSIPEREIEAYEDALKSLEYCSFDSNKSEAYELLEACFGLSA